MQSEAGSDSGAETCPVCGEPVDPTAVVQQERCPECAASIREILQENARAGGV